MVAAVRKLAVVTGTPPEAARQREESFRDWLAGAETVYLECRNHGHVIPGYRDKSASIEVRRGVAVIETPCSRGCGVLLRKLVGVKDGMLMPGGHSAYDYSGAPGYLLPPAACDGAAMSRERRGTVRLELLERGLAERGTSLTREIARDRRRKEK